MTILNAFISQIKYNMAYFTNYTFLFTLLSGQDGKQTKLCDTNLCTKDRLQQEDQIRLWWYQDFVSSVLKPEIKSSLEVCTISNESLYDDIAQADISTFKGVKKNMSSTEQDWVINKFL